MGDTGSLALGGALGTVAVLIKREFWLVLVGGVFVAEALSVMIQVASFKLWGRRVFRMAPLHHHFELLGLGRVARRAALLHRRRAARPALALDAQAAMTIDARHPLPGTRPLVVGAARSGLAAARLLRAARRSTCACATARAAAERGRGRARARGARRRARAGARRRRRCSRAATSWSGARASRSTTRSRAAARARGIPVLSELELGYLAAHAPLVCVTGTNGKSTTTDLVGRAAARGRARGRGVRQHRPRDLRGRRGAWAPTGLLVVEVSSFQLETVRPPQAVRRRRGST